MHPVYGENYSPDYVPMALFVLKPYVRVDDETPELLLTKRVNEGVLGAKAQAVANYLHYNVFGQITIVKHSNSDEVYNDCYFFFPYSAERMAKMAQLIGREHIACWSVDRLVIYDDAGQLNSEYRGIEFEVNTHLYHSKQAYQETIPYMNAPIEDAPIDPGDVYLQDTVAQFDLLFDRIKIADST